MAWTKKQLADAKRMYKAKGNRKSWPECIASATKGGKVGAKKKAAPKKRAASVGRKPKVVAKKVTTRKTVTTRLAGISGDAMKQLQSVQSNIQREEKYIADMQGKKAKLPLKERKAIGADIVKRKAYVQVLKKNKTSLKKFI